MAGMVRSKICSDVEKAGYYSILISRQTKNSSKMEQSCSEDRQVLTQQRRERYNNTRSTEEQRHSISHKVPSYDDPVIVNKITEFYSDLTTVEIKKCSICSE